MALYYYIFRTYSCVHPPPDTNMTSDLKEELQQSTRLDQCFDVNCPEQEQLE